MNNVKSQPLRFPYSRDGEISEEYKDFIRGTLEINEANRYSWDEVFNHSIFKKSQS